MFEEKEKINRKILNVIYILCMKERPIPRIPFKDLQKCTDKIVLLFSDEVAEWALDINEKKIEIKRVAQEVVEKHYWLFGEQYSLITAAEPDFEQALKGLLIATKGDDSKVIIDHEDKNKEMDIYMIRQDRRGNVTENVVVELKRPTVPLGEEQLSQVKKYMRVP